MATGEKLILDSILPTELLKGSYYDVWMFDKQKKGLDIFEGLVDVKKLVL